MYGGIPTHQSTDTPVLPVCSAVESPGIRSIAKTAFQYYSHYCRRHVHVYRVGLNPVMALGPCMYGIRSSSSSLGFPTFTCLLVWAVILPLGAEAVCWCLHTHLKPMISSHRFVDAPVLLASLRSFPPLFAIAVLTVFVFFTRWLLVPLSISSDLVLARCLWPDIHCSLYFFHFFTTPPSLVCRLVAHLLSRWCHRSARSLTTRSTGWPLFYFRTSVVLRF